MRPPKLKLFHILVSGQTVGLLLKPELPSEGSPIKWSNLSGAAFALALAETVTSLNDFLVIVLEDQRQLQILETELHFFLGENSAISIINFPSWECLPYDVFSPHQDITSDRLRILAQLPYLKTGILLTTCTNLMQRLPPVEYVSGHSFSLKAGQVIRIDGLRKQLADANYAAVEQVVSPGEFAVRGGLIDLYPMGTTSPFRIDLFDDEIESIRHFDPETQRSQGQIESIELLPAKEFPMTESGIKQFRSAFRRQFEGDPRKQHVYNEISNGNTPAGAEFFFPLFFSETATLFDYISNSSVLVLEHRFAEIVSTQWAEITDRYTNANYDAHRKVLPPGDVYLDPLPLIEIIDTHRQIVFHPEKHKQRKQDRWIAPCDNNRQFPVDVKKDVPYEDLLSHLKSTKNRILMTTETPGRREAMEAMLLNHQCLPIPCADFNEFLTTPDLQLGLCISGLERGFTSNELNLEIITESQLYGERVFQRRRRSNQSQDPESIIKSLAELNVGDPVVHIDHGVGRYLGLQTLNISDEETEFLTLEYQNNDKLYIPILSLNLISRFVGGSPETAPIHRLGTDQWEKAKKQAKEKAYDVAAELLEIEALRNARTGFAFEIIADDYDGFVSRFPFEETPDQEQAINEVLNGLTAPEPMDRLVCGDVGFGKTEVALRAAFVAASNGKQVALLVPTTLLAQQHYQTFVDRFADMSITVGLLSRFNTKKQTTELLSGMAQGSPLIVVGTHKLLQDDIRFQDLGLLIIDEEHRFGVRQKEKIKQLRSQVDILTLTATPIPRTLNITMSGLRSISIIATPPSNRLSIKTFIRELNHGLIREACLREIRRGGQVYFLHNDVKTMERTVEELTELIPEAKIDFGHGQMGETQLERVMQDFYHQRFNILVCTTIVESGIDIPSANTIIINRADKLGLAQLHQIRGRVGRSHHQAYAYLLIPDRKLLTSDAKKRLNAIESMEDLGAGFALASHDLEIRGAGELLGETQSGLIDDVGFSLYSEYLTMAVNSIKEGRIPERRSQIQTKTMAVVDLHLPALFPQDYLSNAHTRLILYKRIANAPDHHELEELQIETVDRFGLMPPSAKNLFQLTALRLSCEKLGIKKIEIDNKGGEIEFVEKPSIDPSAIFKLIQQNPSIYQLGGPSTIRIKADLTEPETRIKKVNSIIEQLSTGLLED
ncbi:MAG: transcription-repair coupling factor [Gammaproteobacteria bacterium]|nr:transcription-repair coupling factor [Gammaproteobacteria bacterium]